MAQSSGDPQPDPTSLYSKCEQREREIISWGRETLKKYLVSSLKFGSKRKNPEGRHSDDYGALVEALRKAKNRDDLWLFLAAWLNWENICKPEDFLPPKIYARLTRNAAEGLKGISFSDVRYFELVTSWKPYFSKMLEDRKQLGSKTELAKTLCTLGYQPETVVLFTRKHWRSPIELACEWLAERPGVCSNDEKADPISALRNAYSRIKSGARPQWTRLQSRSPNSAPSGHAKKAE